MNTVLWIVAVLGLMMAWAARKRAVELEEKVKAASREASGSVSELEELSQKVKSLGSLVALMAGGHEVDALMDRLVSEMGGGE